MTIDLKPVTLECGHTITPKPGSISTGKALDPHTRRTMCYPCAEAAERKAFEEADVYSLYVSGDGKHLTTWTGAVLADVVSYDTGSRQYTPTGGAYRMEYVRAEAPDGSLWYGSKSDGVDLLRVRRARTN